MNLAGKNDKQLRRMCRELHRDLYSVTMMVGIFLRALDAEMAKSESPERGARIAELANALNYWNDRARYSSLGVNFRKDRRPTGPPSPETLEAFVAESRRIGKLRRELLQGD